MRFVILLEKAYSLICNALVSHSVAGQPGVILGFSLN